MRRPCVACCCRPAPGLLARLPSQSEKQQAAAPTAACQIDRTCNTNPPQDEHLPAYFPLLSLRIPSRLPHPPGHLPPPHPPRRVTPPPLPPKPRTPSAGWRTTASRPCCNPGAKILGAETQNARAEAPAPPVAVFETPRRRRGYSLRCRRRRRRRRRKRRTPAAAEQGRHQAEVD